MAVNLTAPNIEIVIFICLGLLVGGFLVWFALSRKYQANLSHITDGQLELQTRLAVCNEQIQHLGQHNDALSQDKHAVTSQLALLDARLLELTSQLARATARHESSAEQAETLTGKLLSAENRAEAYSQQNTGYREQLSSLQTSLLEERKRTAEQLAVLNEAKSLLSDEFKNLANEIFEEKSQKFTSQNQHNLEQILKPLSGQIQDFRKQVEDSYDKESKDRFSLIREIQGMQELNSRIGEDAANLTSALKGNNKVQGTWGELALERILETSGLVKGREYDVQVSITSQSGRRLQPDVVVHLPEQKDVIVDAKMTLTAYHRYVSAPTIEEQEVAAAQHLQSVHTHIKELSSKDYQNLLEFHNLDFVLMFLPVEAAFNLAVQRDPLLFSKAFERNIILVGPSTLLATLRTIEHIWRNEYQTQNAQEIAQRAGRLYDKFVSFVADLEEVGQRLHKAQSAYDGAHNKLVSGRGNLVRGAEKLKELGAKTSKRIAKQLINESAQHLQPVDRKDQGEAGK